MFIILKQRNKPSIIIGSIIFGLISGFVIEGILAVNPHLLELITSPFTSETVINILGWMQLLPFILLSVILGAVCYVCFLFGDIIGPFVYKYRYCFAIGIVVFCVILNISGSSIAVWNNYLPQSSDPSSTGTLFGISRSIRSDEWCVNTPMAFSQAYNQTGAFPYFGDTVRGANTDMFIVYGQPVWNIAVLFRPFHWGYLLFGAERGLAFFWSARLVALFMVSFEMGMLLTHKNKRLSVALAVLVSFAPAVQWWFAVNGFVEMLVFGQLAILIVYHYLKTSNYLYRILLALGLVICGGAFILTFYPAWQVPMAYIYLAMLIWVIWDRKKECTFCLKKDLPIIIGFFLILGISMLYIFTKSADTIQLVLNTAYPGDRIGLGGGQFQEAFGYASNLFTPYDNALMTSNPVEMALFFDFFPLGLLLSLWVVFCEKQRDKLLICLLAVDVFLSLYCFVQWPTWLAKITLMGYSTSNRVLLVVGFLNLLLLFRAITMMRTKPRLSHTLLIAIPLSLFVSFICIAQSGDYMSKAMMCISIFVLFVGFSLVLKAGNRGYQYWFLLFCCIVGLVAGGMVNPIQQGTDVVYNNPLVQDISEITHADHGEGLWMVEGEGVGFPMGNLPIMVGAPTINSTNVYPNMERWEQLDPTGEYEQAYNRYAHIHVILTDEPTSFNTPTPDQFILYLNYQDLEKLNPKYILTKGDLSSVSEEGLQFSLLEQEGEYQIYQVHYTD